MIKKTQQKLLNIVECNYREIADHFNETRKKKISSLWQNLINISKNIENNSSILDLGCGNGRLLTILKNKKINYLGIDNNKKLLENARLLHPEFNFQDGNILDIKKIKTDQFDYIFCIATLHHIPGNDLQIQVLKQCRKKLKKNGKIIFTVWNFWPQPKFRKLILKFAWQKILGKHKMDWGDILFDWKNYQGEVVSQRYYHAFHKRELIKIAKQSGLKIEKIYKDNYNYLMELSPNTKLS